MVAINSKELCEAEILMASVAHMSVINELKSTLPLTVDYSDFLLTSFLPFSVYIMQKITSFAA